jgi:hypothetical protein
VTNVSDNDQPGRSGSHHTPLIVLLGTIGCVASSLATVVSFLSATGRLPAGLGLTTSQFSVSRQIWGIPIEFGFVVAFASLMTLHLILVRLQHPNVQAYTMVLSTAILGTTFGLALGNPSAIPLWAASSAAAGLLIISAARETRRLRDVARALLSDLRTVRRSQAALTGMAAWLLAVVCVAQAIAAGAATTSRSEADSRALLSWFTSQRPLTLQELRAGEGLKVVVFTDHQCPACIGLVPQYRDVVSALRLRGFAVDLAIRAFPLEAECNDVTGVTVHPFACEAAAAAQLVSLAAPANAVDFEEWLYATGKNLSRDSIRTELSRLRLDAQFDTRYEELLQSVREDASLGRRAGVYATPTVFLNGVKLPNVTPAGLEKLAGHAATLVATPLMRLP